MKGIIKYLVLVLGFFLLLTLGFFVWAESNGIWVDAQDIRGGTFGLDEDDNMNNYVFVNSVDFQDEVKVRVIKSNSANGNVNIVLG